MISKLKRTFKNLVRPIRNRRFQDRDIVSIFDRLGVSTSRPLLIHSSLSAFGYVPGGPHQIITAIRNAVAPGTLIAMPTHTWSQVSQGLRIIDIESTPSCVGAISEAFRQLPTSLRSLHPTHSIAADGSGAIAIVEGHENSSTPCGCDTPYYRLMKDDVQILFLGAPLTSNTCYHGIEAVAGVDYLLCDAEDEFSLVLQDGSHVRTSIRRHRPKVPRCIKRMEKDIFNAGILKTCCLFGKKFHLIEGGRFLEFATQQVKDNCNYLLPTGSHFPGAQEES